MNWIKLQQQINEIEQQAKQPLERNGVIHQAN